MKNMASIFNESNLYISKYERIKPKDAEEKEEDEEGSEIEQVYP